jgi:hypothetical protein
VTQLLAHATGRPHPTPGRAVLGKKPLRPALKSAQPLDRRCGIEAVLQAVRLSRNVVV